MKEVVGKGREGRRGGAEMTEREEVAGWGVGTKGKRSVRSSGMLLMKRECEGARLGAEEQGQGCGGATRVRRGSAPMLEHMVKQTPCADERSTCCACNGWSGCSKRSNGGCCWAVLPAKSR